MSLLNTMRADLLKARKNRDEVETGVLTALVDGVAMVGKNSGNRETTDEEAVRVVKKFLDNSHEIERLLGARSDSAEALEKTRTEIAVLERYMPSQMSEGDLRSAVIAFVRDNQNAKIGDVMAFLKNNFAGRYDGKVASAIARGLI